MTKLLIMLAIFNVVASAAAREAHFGGYINATENQTVISKENFKKAADHCKKTSGINKVRVLALVDSTFNPSELAEYGWVLRSRVTSDIVTIEGPAETAKYLSVLNCIHTSNFNIKATPSADDSVRKLSFLNEVYGNGISNLPKNFDGEGILIGVMDTEFDTKHPAFLDSLGNSRFVAIWDQNDSTGPKPTYGYGTIRNRAQIKADSNFALSTGVHGTWVAGIAAGSHVGTNSFYGVAPKSTLIGVRYTGEINDLADGIRWIFKVADSLKMPCVINMSIGLQEGPHDGSSLIDRVIDSLSGNGKIIVGAAGNDGDSRAHTGFTLAKNETKGTWAVAERYTDRPGHEKTTAGIDIWGKSGMYYTAVFYVIDTATMVYHQLQPSISTSSTGQYVDTLYVTDSVSKKMDTLYFYRLSERRSALNNKAHIEALLVSTNLNMYFGVKITNSSSAIDTINTWNIYKHAFKSLNMPGFYNGDTLMSINEVGGTAKRNITVGSYVSSLDMKLWDGIKTGEAGYPHERNLYSSMGPTVDGRIKPDIMAPGCRIACPQSRAGLDDKIIFWPDPSSKQGRYTYSEGTSFAAPVVTGVVALMLQIKPSLSPEEAKSVLQQTTYTDEHTGIISSPNNMWGAGKLNALGALQKLTGVTRNEIAVKTDEHNFSIRTLKNSIILSGTFTGIIKPELMWYTLNGKLITSYFADVDKAIPVPQSAAQVMILKVKAQRCEKTFLLQK
jgi:subtilisin family serine protease